MSDSNYTSNKWHGRYVRLAKDVASWSKDPSTKVGAVIIGNKGQIISQGFNGFPRGIADTPERYNDRPTKYKYVVHAEANAIYNAIHNGANTNGATIYVTGLPVCHECAKAIIQTGIANVVMDTHPNETTWKESGQAAVEMMLEAGVTIRFLKESECS
jgi:dCMP deaminase